MATKYYLQPTGNFSTAANWNGGTVPVAGDMVYANGKVITLDADYDLGNGTLTSDLCPDTGLIGGTFNAPTSRTTIANIVGCYTGVADTATHTIIGNVTSNTKPGILLNQTTAATCYINIYGNLTSTNHYGIQITNTGAGRLTSVTVTGNITSSSSHSAICGFLSPSLPLVLLGTCTSLGTPIVAGNSYASILNVTGVINASATSPAFVTTLTTSIARISGILNNYGSMMAIAGYYNVYFSPSNSTSWKFYDTNNVEKPLYTADAFNIAESDYRKDAIFGLANEFIGTLAVPPPSQVVKDTPTDNTVGTWAFDSGLIARLENVATTDEVGNIVSSYNV